MRNGTHKNIRSLTFVGALAAPLIMLYIEILFSMISGAANLCYSYQVSSCFMISCISSIAFVRPLILPIIAILLFSVFAFLNFSSCSFILSSKRLMIISANSLWFKIKSLLD